SSCTSRSATSPCRTSATTATTPAWCRWGGISRRRSPAGDGARRGRRVPVGLPVGGGPVGAVAGRCPGGRPVGHRRERGALARQAARTTLPALRHRVHTRTRRVLPPPAGVRTVWMFGSQRRRVRRCEWDTLLPKLGFLPQMSHTLDTGDS